MSQQKILVTAALPYANGHIHLGHLVEYIQTDIWVRFQKLKGNKCIFVCADDTHGTAIMIRARQEGRSEEALIAEMKEAHERDFAGFDIQFDNYGSTNSPENRECCATIWTGLRQAELIVEKEVSQLYDTKAGTFLADRFVKGTCPKCNSPDQYGDTCDKCGSTYSPSDLKDPLSTLSGTKPELRSAKHLFVKIEGLHPFLEQWTQSGEHLQPEIANYLKGHFLGEPLHDWDISRPAPYFGFEIPDSPGNYWYVWFDAPIRLYGLADRMVPETRLAIRRVVAVRQDGKRARTRDSSLHRQGHHLLPHAVLAGDAARGQVQIAEPGAHPRFPDCRRRENVEVEGNVHPMAAHTSNILTRRSCDITTRRSFHRRSTTWISTSTSSWRE